MDGRANNQSPSPALANSPEPVSGGVPTILASVAPSRARRKLSGGNGASSASPYGDASSSMMPQHYAHASSPFTRPPHGAAPSSGSTGTTRAPPYRRVSNGAKSSRNNDMVPPEAVPSSSSSLPCNPPPLGRGTTNKSAPLISPPSPSSGSLALKPNPSPNLQSNHQYDTLLRGYHSGSAPVTLGGRNSMRRRPHPHHSSNIPSSSAASSSDMPTAQHSSGIVPGTFLSGMPAAASHHDTTTLFNTNNATIAADERKLRNRQRQQLATNSSSSSLMPPPGSSPRGSMSGPIFTSMHHDNFSSSMLAPMGMIGVNVNTTLSSSSPDKCVMASSSLSRPHLDYDGIGGGGPSMPHGAHLGRLQSVPHGSSNPHSVMHQSMPRFSGTAEATGIGGIHGGAAADVYVMDTPNAGAMRNCAAGDGHGHSSCTSRGLGNDNGKEEAVEEQAARVGKKSRLSSRRHGELTACQPRACDVPVPIPGREGPHEDPHPPSSRNGMTVHNFDPPKRGSPPHAHVSVRSFSANTTKVDESGGGTPTRRKKRRKESPTQKEEPAGHAHKSTDDAGNPVNMNMDLDLGSGGTINLDLGGGSLKGNAATLQSTPTKKNRKVRRRNSQTTTMIPMPNRIIPSSLTGAHGHDDGDNAHASRNASRVATKDVPENETLRGTALSPPVVRAGNDAPAVTGVLPEQKNRRVSGNREKHERDTEQEADHVSGNDGRNFCTAASAAAADTSTKTESSSRGKNKKMLSSPSKINRSASRELKNQEMRASPHSLAASLSNVILDTFNPELYYNCPSSFLNKRKKKKKRKHNDGACDAGGGDMRNTSFSNAPMSSFRAANDDNHGNDDNRIPLVIEETGPPPSSQSASRVDLCSVTNGAALETTNGATHEETETGVIGEYARPIATHAPLPPQAEVCGPGERLNNVIACDSSSPRVRRSKKGRKHSSRMRNILEIEPLAPLVKHTMCGEEQGHATSVTIVQSFSMGPGHDPAVASTTAIAPGPSSKHASQDRSMLTDQQQQQQQQQQQHRQQQQPCEDSTPPPSSVRTDYQRDQLLQVLEREQVVVPQNYPLGKIRTNVVVPVDGPRPKRRSPGLRLKRRTATETASSTQSRAPPIENAQNADEQLLAHKNTVGADTPNIGNARTHKNIVGADTPNSISTGNTDVGAASPSTPHRRTRATNTRGRRASGNIVGINDRGGGSGDDAPTPREEVRRPRNNRSDNICNRANPFCLSPLKKDLASEAQLPPQKIAAVSSVSPIAAEIQSVCPPSPSPPHTRVSMQKDERGNTRKKIMQQKSKTRKKDHEDEDGNDDDGDAPYSLGKEESSSSSSPPPRKRCGSTRHAKGSSNNTKNTNGGATGPSGRRRSNITRSIREKEINTTSPAAAASSPLSGGQAVARGSKRRKIKSLLHTESGDNDSDASTRGEASNNTSSRQKRQRKQPTRQRAASSCRSDKSSTCGGPLPRPTELLASRRSRRVVIDEYEDIMPPRTLEEWLRESHLWRSKHSPLVVPTGTNSSRTGACNRLMASFDFCPPAPLFRDCQPPPHSKNWSKKEKSMMGGRSRATLPMPDLLYDMAQVENADERSILFRICDRNTWVSGLVEMSLLASESGYRTQEKLPDDELHTYDSKPLPVDYIFDRLATDVLVDGWQIRCRKTGCLQGFLTFTQFRTFQPMLFVGEPFDLAKKINGSLVENSHWFDGNTYTEVVELVFLGALGCGTLLMDQFLDSLSKTHIKYVIVHSTVHASHFYKKFGFREITARGRYKLIQEQQYSKVQFPPVSPNDGGYGYHMLLLRFVHELYVRIDHGTPNLRQFAAIAERGLFKSLSEAFKFILPHLMGNDREAILKVYDSYKFEYKVDRKYDVAITSTRYKNAFMADKATYPYCHWVPKRIAKEEISHPSMLLVLEINKTKTTKKGGSAHSISPTISIIPPDDTPTEGINRARMGKVCSEPITEWQCPPLYRWVPQRPNEALAPGIVVAFVDAPPATVGQSNGSFWYIDDLAPDLAWAHLLPMQKKGNFGPSREHRPKWALQPRKDRKREASVSMFRVTQVHADCIRARTNDPEHDYWDIKGKSPGSRRISVKK